MTFTYDTAELTRLYKGDPEAAHAIEDDLLWAFVAYEVERGNGIVSDLLAWHHKNLERTRWYA